MKYKRENMPHWFGDERHIIDTANEERWKYRDRNKIDVQAEYEYLDRVSKQRINIELLKRLDTDKKLTHLYDKI